MRKESIRRVIFYSLTKPFVNEKGEKEIDTISTSQALQIAGRAGRFNTQFPEGFYTTFKSNDLETLKNIMDKSIDPLDKAGLHPPYAQVELFAYHLPHATLSNLIDIFISLCMIDSSSYFMCDTEGFKYLADKIQHIPLPLKARYDFCCAPINRKEPFVVTMFVKFAKQYSQNEPLTVEKLCKDKNVGWPFSPPQKKSELIHQEAVFDVLDLYLWLSYRFQDLFPDVQDVRRIQRELDETIQKGVFNIIHLLKEKDPEISNDQEHTVKKANEVKNIDYEKNNSLEDEGSYTSGQGKFTSQLLAQGLITPKMLKNLRKEWEASLEDKDADSSNRRSSKIKTRRNKKK